jgi:hypothetical protein
MLKALLAKLKRDLAAKNKAQMAEEARLRKALVRAKHAPRSYDACGVLNGNEASCANTRASKTCYAVGDPHYRTFDGVAYDWQPAGQYVFAQHGPDFEVQNLQRHHGGPSWNHAVAVRGGNNVAIYYNTQQGNRVLINGVQKAIANAKWTRVGPGLLIRRDGTTHQFRYTKKGLTATVKLASINLYVTAPWQWSSGRSMFGLCGDYSANSGDDRWFVAKNTNRQIRVTNTVRDLFKHPQKKNFKLPQEDEEAEAEADAQLDADLDVVHADTIPALEHFIVPAVTDVDDDGNETPKKLSMRDIAAQFPADKVAAAVKTCGALPSKQELNDCVLDAVMGMKDAREVQQQAEEQGLDVLLKKCLPINPTTFGMYANKRLPPPKNTDKNGTKIEDPQGYSFALFFNPEAITGDGTILEKGAQMTIAQHDDQFVVTAGGATCSAEKALIAAKWTHISAAVSSTGALTVFINGKESCKAAGTKLTMTEDNVFVGGSREKIGSAVGRVAHLIYVPLTLTANQATDHGTVSPLSCTGKIEPPPAL